MAIGKNTVDLSNVHCISHDHAFVNMIHVIMVNDIVKFIVNT